MLRREIVDRSVQITKTVGLRELFTRHLEVVELMAARDVGHGRESLVQLPVGPRLRVEGDREPTSTIVAHAARGRSKTAAFSSDQPRGRAIPFCSICSNSSGVISAMVVGYGVASVGVNEYGSTLQPFFGGHGRLCVIGAVMPKGVEHTTIATIVASDWGRDAERR